MGTLLEATPTKCRAAWMCPAARAADSLNGDLADGRRAPDPETKAALAFVMSRVVSGRCPACGRLAR